VEAVLHVVEIADLEVAVDLVELLRTQKEVLHLRTAGPLDADVERAACQRLRDDTDQSDPVAEQRRTIHFDHEAEDVLAVQEDRRGSVNTNCPVAMVLSAAGASRMNGSQQGPAKRRTPAPLPPSGSSTGKEICSPRGVRQIPVSAPSASPGSENTHAKANSSAPTS